MCVGFLSSFNPSLSDHTGPPPKMLPIDFGSIDAIMKKQANLVEDRVSSVSSDERAKADHLVVLVHG